MRKDFETLCHIGRMAFGNSWEHSLEVELAVKKTLLDLWASGRAEIPENIWSEMAEICRAKADGLSMIADTWLNTPKLRLQ